MQKNLRIIVIGIFILIISQSLILSAYSNASIQAKELLKQSEKTILEMIEKNITVIRVNETYQDALQIYLAQLALEGKGGRANYKLITAYTLEIEQIKKIAIQSADELKIFEETFREVEKNTNLSEMQNEYNQVINSFNDERFEDTIELIEIGYNKISEIQSSQTTLNAFYLTTTKSIKNFLAKNWLKIIVTIIVLSLLTLIFKNNLRKLRMRIKYNNLLTQKKALNKLIQKIQKSYFKTQNISEAEYKTKLKKFKELIRESDRQIMTLKEEIFKLKEKKEKPLKEGKKETVLKNQNKLLLRRKKQ
jgi:hypothetical protein